MLRLLLLTALSFSTFATWLHAGINGTPQPYFTSSIGRDSVAPDAIAQVQHLTGREGFKNLFTDNAFSSNLEVKLNPLAISFVQGYVKSHSGQLNKMKGWGKPYFDMMDVVLTQYGLPAELKYLAVIESQLKSTAVSWAGAVGPWQFMPATARLLGLKVNKSIDERKDYKKSTHAAAKYLNNLYSIYNDWLLVIAAYNGGPGRVNSAIKRSGSRNFWELQRFLPEESRNHVKKFIATHYIMEGQGGLTTLTKVERDNYQLALPQPVAENLTSDAMHVAVKVSGRYNGQVIAQSIGMDFSSFNKLNPGFDQQLAMGNDYVLRLPADKMKLFQEQKLQILDQSIRAALTMASK